MRLSPIAEIKDATLIICPITNKMEFKVCLKIDMEDGERELELRGNLKDILDNIMQVSLVPRSEVKRYIIERCHITNTISFKGFLIKRNSDKAEIYTNDYQIEPLDYERIKKAKQQLDELSKYYTYSEEYENYFWTVFRWFIYAPFMPSLKIIHQERTIDLMPYLLIIGPPQAGKTTLANIMQGLYLDKNDLEEAYRSIGPDGFKTPPRIAKQLSYTNFPLIVNEFYTYGMQNKYEIYENLKASFSLHFRLLGFRDKEESDYSLRAICFTANRLDYIPDKALYRRLYTIHLSTMFEIPKEKKEEFAKFIRNLYLKPLGNLAIWMVLDEPELLECNFVEFGDIFLRKIERFDALNKIIEATIDPDDINIYLEDILKNLSKQISKELKDISQIGNLEGLYKGRKEGIDYIYLTKRFFIKYLPDIDMKDFVNLLREHKIEAEYGYAKIGNKTTRVCRIPENVFLDLIALRCGLTEIEDEQSEEKKEEDVEETKPTFESEFVKMLEQFIYSEDKEMVYPSPSDSDLLLKILEALEPYFDINMDTAFIKIKKREAKYNVIEMLKDIKSKLLEQPS